MPETRIEKGLFVLGVLATFALGLIVAHLWQHTHRAAAVSTTSSSPPARTTFETQQGRTSAATTDTASTVPRTTTGTRTRRAKNVPPAARVTSLLLTAKTNTWIEIRTGSATGVLLYSGTLAASSTKTFRARALWARFGAAGNLSARLNGKPIGLPSGTYDAAFDGHGFRRLGA